MPVRNATTCSAGLGKGSYPGSMQPVQKISCKCTSPGLIALCLAALLLCFSPAQAAAPLARPILRDEQPSSGSSTGTTAQPEAHAARNVHSPFNSEASVQVAARQKLFDFAVQEGLEILNLVIQKVQIPDYNTTLDFPVIGGVDVSITGINISQLVVPPELTKVAIESGYYHLQASNLTTQVRDFSGRELPINIYAEQHSMCTLAGVPAMGAMCSLVRLEKTQASRRHIK